jgi:hypothetical protein
MRKSKFGNVKTEIDGHVFASKREANRYSELKLLQMAGKINKLQLQVPFDCCVGGKKICKYIADFVYCDLETGSIVIEDAKGFKTSVYKLKKKMVEAIFNVRIIEV